MKTIKSRKSNKRKLVFLIVFVASIVTIVVVSMLKPKEAKQINNLDEAVRRVSVVEETPGSYPVKINVLGEVTPQWKSEIKSQVDGRILNISDQFRIGTIVEKGDPIITIESSSYEVILTEAKSRLASAKINLLREQKIAEDALANWKRSGIDGEPASELVLHRPQVEAAQNEVEAAHAAVRNAQLQLSYTQLKAPFNGIITERLVNKGEALGVGTPIYTIFSVDKALITVQVSNKQFRLLSSNLEDIDATLLDKELNYSWKAKVVRQGNVVDNASRLRSVILEVSKPLSQSPPLLAGQFVNVELKGEKLSNLLKAPESALTDGGFVWYVNNKNQLQSFKVEPMFYQDNEFYFTLPKGVKVPIQIAINPNSSFMNGITAEPQIVRGE